MTTENLHVVLNALDEAFLLVNDHRVIIWSNAAAKSLLGQDLEGQSLVRILRQPIALACLNEVLSGAQKSQGEIYLDTPVRAAFRLTAVRLRQDEEQDAHVAIGLRDVSALLDAAQMRSDFVANVSHELRSPLTTLTGFIETLQGHAKDDADARNRFLPIMQREAERMGRLIADLLSLSKVEANEKIRPATALDLRQIVETVLATMAQREDLKKHKVLFDKPDSPMTVIGDADQLSQVFINILENAARYSPLESDITLKMEERSIVPGFRTSVIVTSVQDQGEGIKAQDIPRLTERFYRVDSGRSRSVGGTGLGLAIVKHILSRHRGKMTIDSTVGKGTCVSVFLPQRLAP